MRLPRLSFTLSIPRPPSPSFLFSSSRRFLTPRSFGLLFQRVQREAGEASYWKVYDDTTTDYPLLQHPTHAFNRAYKLVASHAFSSTMPQASPFVPSFPSSSSSSFATLLLLFCNGVKRREKAKRGNDQRTVTHKCRSINFGRPQLGHRNGTRSSISQRGYVSTNDSPRNANNFLSRPAVSARSFFHAAITVAPNLVNP